jgi:hypothetical protein
MATINSEIEFQGNNDAWFTTNASVVYDAGIIIYHTDGRYKFSDSVTALSALPFRGLTSTGTTDGLQSGGIITVLTIDGTGTNNDIRITPASWLISSMTYSTAINTEFLNIALSSAGLQRYVGIYGNTSNAITKVEGTEAALATYPTTPVNSIVIGYVLVNDASASSTPDLSGYLLKLDKATQATNVTGTNDTTYVTPLANAVKANLASPTFTGTPLAPTATVGTSTTQLATTAFVEASKNKSEYGVLANTSGSYINVLKYNCNSASAILSGVTSIKGYKFTPQNDISIVATVVEVTTLIAASQGVIIIWECVNDLPATYIGKSATINTDSTGIKEAVFPTTVLSGKKSYFICYHGTTLGVGFRALNAAVSHENNISKPSDVRKYGQVIINDVSGFGNYANSPVINNYQETGTTGAVLIQLKTL